MKRNNIFAREQTSAPLKQKLQEFSAILAVLFVILADLWILYFDVGVISTIFLFFTGIIFLITFSRPLFLLPIWRLWIIFFEYLSKASFSLILISIWLCIFIPIGIIGRILHLRFVDMSINKNCQSYWHTMSKGDNNHKNMSQMR